MILGNLQEAFECERTQAENQIRRVSRVEVKIPSEAGCNIPDLIAEGLIEFCVVH